MNCMKQSFENGWPIKFEIRWQKAAFVGLQKCISACEMDEKKCKWQQTFNDVACLALCQLFFSTSPQLTWLQNSLPSSLIPKQNKFQLVNFSKENENLTLCWTWDRFLWVQSNFKWHFFHTFLTLLPHVWHFSLLFFESCITIWNQFNEKQSVF